MNTTVPAREADGMLEASRVRPGDILTDFDLYVFQLGSNAAPGRAQLNCHDSNGDEVYLNVPALKPLAVQVGNYGSV